MESLALLKMVGQRTRSLRAGHGVPLEEAARDGERRWVARELHDELGQVLTALRYALAFARDRATRAPGRAAPAIAECEALLARSDRTLRGLLEGFRPPNVEELGLAMAVEWLCAEAELRWGLDGEVRWWRRPEGGTELRATLPTGAAPGAERASRPRSASSWPTTTTSCGTA